MLESSLEFIKCVNCGSKLELDSFKQDKEIIEGILECPKCHGQYPIIEKIPILWNNFSLYLSSRKKLGGKLYQLIENSKLKKFCKSSLSNISQTFEDRTTLEERWSLIYQNSKSSKFYSEIQKNLTFLQKSNLVLEYGCSIGIMTSFLAKSNKMVFGVDRSFSALRIAKKLPKNNLDYVVADFLSPIFGKFQFDLVLADIKKATVLNIESITLARLIREIQTENPNNDFLIELEDPQTEFALLTDRRKTNLQNLDFKITPETKTPSHMSWILKLNPRATLNYDVDLVIAKK